MLRCTLIIGVAIIAAGLVGANLSGGKGIKADRSLIEGVQTDKVDLQVQLAARTQIVKSFNDEFND